MKNLFMPLLSVSLFLTAPLFSQTQTCPDNNVAKIAIIQSARAQGTTLLHQSDFDTGTYRIKKGGYYKIVENVEFNPSNGRPDEPQTGWNFIISVETSDNVVVDFGGHLVEATQSFIDNHTFNVFAIVEFDNSPFGPVLFGTLGSNFTGDTQFVAGNNIVVRNGIMGRSAHWGAHGNLCNNIHIENMKIKDFEVAGIELNSGQGGSIKNVEISGLEHPINTNEFLVSAIVFENLLAELVAGGFPGAAAQLAALQAYVAAHPEIFNRVLLVPEADAYYGIIIGNGGLILADFPVTAQGCITSQIVGGGAPTTCYDITNVFIHDLHNAPLETIDVGSQIPGPLFGNNIIVGLAGGFGSLAWFDAYDAAGNFAPNAFITAQAFAINAIVYVLGLAPATLFPPNTQAILNAILTVNHTEWLANALPVFGVQFDAAAVNKGTFGIRVDCCENFNISNYKVNNLQNTGNPGLSLADIPDGSAFIGIVTEERYQGNDIWGIELGDDTNFTLNRICASNLNTLNGQVFGIDLINLGNNITVTNTASFNMIGQSDSQTTVNPPSEAYGLRVQNNAGPVTITNHTAINTTAPRVAFGLATEGTTGVTFTNCKACNTTVTATDPAGPDNKTAYGFYSAHSDITGNPSINTAFRNCKEKNSLVLGESNVTSQTNSIGAGYVFTDASVGGVVDSSLALNNHSGGGTANGVRIDMGSSNTTVSNNRLISNIADLPFATGFGVIDTAAHSTTTLINNFFANNSTANISVNP
jgi:hypothetical protein